MDYSQRGQKAIQFYVCFVSSNLKRFMAFFLYASVQRIINNGKDSKNHIRWWMPRFGISAIQKRNKHAGEFIIILANTLLIYDSVATTKWAFKLTLLEGLKMSDDEHTLWIVKDGCKCLNPSNGAREQLVTNFSSIHLSFGSNPLITWNNFWRKIRGLQKGNK